MYWDHITDEFLEERKVIFSRIIILGRSSKTKYERKSKRYLEMFKTRKIKYKERTTFLVVLHIIRPGEYEGKEDFFLTPVLEEDPSNTKGSHYKFGHFIYKEFLSKLSEF